jgi:hypothetical protein
MLLNYILTIYSEISLISATGIAQPGQDLIAAESKALESLKRAIGTINKIPGASATVLKNLKETLDATKGMLLPVWAKAHTNLSAKLSLLMKTPRST